MKKKNEHPCRKLVLSDQDHALLQWIKSKEDPKFSELIKNFEGAPAALKKRIRQFSRQSLLNLRPSFWRD